PAFCTRVRLPAIESPAASRCSALALATRQSARHRGARACRDEPLRPRGRGSLVHVDLPALIQAYGYPVTFIGALLEGETIVTLAGLAVHRGHLHCPALFVLAAAGGSIGATIYFALGR